MSNPPSYDDGQPSGSARPVVSDAKQPMPDESESSESPIYRDGPQQFVFTSLHVLNSTVIQAHSSAVAFITITQEEYTLVKRADGRSLVSIVWHATPDLDFGGYVVSLKKWMSKADSDGAFKTIKHNNKHYDLYQAGETAVGLRENGSREMLCGIRDPNKNVEIVVSPAGMAANILDIAVICVVLLNSRKSLGPEVEGKTILDTLWKGVDYMFRSFGRDSVAGLGPSAGVGRDRP